MRNPVQKKASIPKPHGSRTPSAHSNSWNPLRWDHLVGFEKPMARWQELVSQEKLPPIFMLLGRDGIGKEGLLAYLAALHFCNRGNACGQCTSCQMILQRNHPEVLWVGSSEADSEDSHDKETAPDDGSPLLLADAIRIQDHLQLAAGFGGRYRVVVIPHADRLSGKAANRLLKIFEEPPPHCVVLMSTSRLDRILPTIQSRTVKWRLSPPPVERSLGFLKSIDGYKESKSTLSDDLIIRLLEHFGLAPGPVVRLLRTGVDKVQQAEPIEDLMLYTQKLLGPESLDFFNTSFELVEKPTLQKVLLLGRDWGRRGSLPSMIDTLDRVLNHHYRKSLLDSKETLAQDPFMIQERRGILSKARHLANRQQISLNGQLLLEDIGLTTLNQR